MAKEDSTLSICLPGEDGWELWKQSSSGLVPSQVVSLADGGSPASFTNATVLAYPVRASFTLPTLAQTGDEEMVDAIVSLNLEKNGLKVDNGPGSLTKTRILERNESQCLAVTSLLHESVVTELPSNRPAHFELSPYLYYLPDDSVVVWKELGKLVICLTKQDQPLYFQSLTGSELDTTAVQEIVNILMPLDFQGIASDVRQIMLWTESTPEARQALANALHLPVKSEPRPAPTYTATESSFEPTAVALGKIRDARIRKIRNIVLAAIAVYGGIAALLVGKHMLHKKQNDTLAITKRNLEVQTMNVQPYLDKWNLTAPLRDKDNFTAELLRRIMESVASRTFPIRITSIRITTENARQIGEEETEATNPQDYIKRIEIKAEAKNQNFGSNFRNFLSTSKETKGYEWTAPTWSAIRGDVYPFTINGTSKPPEA